MELDHPLSIFSKIMSLTNSKLDHIGPNEISHTCHFSAPKKTVSITAD
jgi:hypothetical protein